MTSTKHKKIRLIYPNIITPRRTAPRLATAGLIAGGALLLLGSEVEANGSLLQHNSNGPLVQVEQGWLRGVSDKHNRASRWRKRHRQLPVDEFLGVPFAAPPVGKLRFRPPQPPASWTGIADAQELSGLCAQAGAESSEDCLHLNIYRPRTRRKHLPVLFYIHGGSLMVGSASEYRARKLAREIPAVVVTTNYRLNAFGFLTLPATDDPQAPQDSQSGASGLAGNMGLLDQQAALNWVQRNIEQFGGDPSRVTIAGHSAGATSACAHLVSPPSRNQFSAAVLLSGACSSTEKASQDESGVLLSDGLGCTDPATRVECLQDLSVEQLLTGLAGFQADFTLDPELLPLNPQQAIRAGEIAEVPVMIGLTHEEVRIFVSGLFPLAPERYLDNLEGAFPGLSNEVAALYPAADYDDPLYAFSAALSDGLVACPTRRQAAELSSATPTFLYEFDDPAAPAPHWMPVPKGFIMGSTHSSDAPYYFDRKGLVQPDADPFGWAQLSLGRRMRRVLGNFLRTGDPNRAKQKVQWPAYEPEFDQVLRMTPNGLTVTDSYAQSHHCDFWDATLAED